MDQNELQRFASLSRERDGLINSLREVELGLRDMIEDQSWPGPGVAVIDGEAIYITDTADALVATLPSSRGGGHPAIPILKRVHSLYL